MTNDSFKAYYEKYWKDTSVDQDQYDAILEKWKTYREKILSGTLTAEEYNSKNEFFDNGECSLRQFLEHESTDAFFGTLGPMPSANCGLYVTGDKEDKKYKYKNIDLTTEPQKEEKVRKTRDFLKELLQCYTWEELIEYLKNSDVFNNDISSTNFVFEIVFLNSVLKNNDLTDAEKSESKHYDYQYQMVQIYDYADIESNSCFSNLKALRVESEKLGHFQKSKKLMEICRNILGESGDGDRNKVYLYERTVWDCTHTGGDEYKTIISENKNIIFYGAPGTGKTYSVKQAISALGGSDNTVFVQFHPSFSYEDFIEGIRPQGMTSSGNVLVGPVNGVFKSLCMEAKKHPENTYYFVADEINRANLSAVFGETLSLLEDEYRYNAAQNDDQNKKDGRLITTPLATLIKSIQSHKEWSFAEDSNGNVLFGIPKNIVFIGMMNDADKSIDSFDLALRRRFVWILMRYDEKALYNILAANNIKNDEIEKYLSSCAKLNYYITGVNDNKKKIDLGSNIAPLKLGRQFEIGHAIFKNIVKYRRGSGFLKNAYENFFEKYLRSTLTEYLRTYSTEADLEKNIEQAKGIFIK